MNNRILVKVSACESSLAFRTVTKKQKSPHWFYILRSDLERLWRMGSVIASDILSLPGFVANGTEASCPSISPG